jgi:hypothetical protein
MPLQKEVEIIFEQTKDEMGKQNMPPQIIKFNLSLFMNQRLTKRWFSKIKRKLMI